MKKCSGARAHMKAKKRKTGLRRERPKGNSGVTLKIQET